MPPSGSRPSARFVAMSSQTSSNCCQSWGSGRLAHVPPSLNFVPKRAPRERKPHARVSLQAGNPAAGSDEEDAPTHVDLSFCKE